MFQCYIFSQRKEFIFSKRCSSLFVLLFLIIVSLKSQVSVGHSSPPAEGALLQLKQNNNLGVNASKGLIPPRVYLTDKYNLFPMFEDPQNPGNPNSAYSNAEYKAEQDYIHTGLLVFNLTPCAPFGQGLFVWNGQEWKPFAGITTEGFSTLDLLPDSLHIPSGMDKRVWLPQTMSFEYRSRNLPSWGNLVAMPSFQGLQFTNMATQILPQPSTWTLSPAVFSIEPDKMTSTLVTTTNPWHTRESSVTLSLDQAPCGSVVSKTIVLNQTNYAISGRYPASSNTTEDENDILSMITIRNTIPGAVKVLSNTRWLADVESLSDAVSEVLASYTNTIQGENRSNGTFVGSTFGYTGAAGGLGSQFKYVKVTLKDINNRAEDFVITVMQCQGNEDLSSVTVNATPSETSDLSSDWGDNVVRHLENSGVYEEFYSSEFGNAGRWMITNLAATAYDDVAPVGFSSLTESLASSLTVGYFAYPGNSLAAYIENPYLGLLYNFAGANAGYRSNVASDLANTENQTPIQGVCPKGWHLPSDYEWTQLENEIISNTTKYAHVAKNILDNGGSSLPGTTPGGDYRGTHAPAMTNACEVYTGNVQGTSNAISEGGFGAYFAGEINNGTPNEFGATAAYWTSSTYGIGQAYYRVMSTSIGDTGVAAFANGRANYMSVRCKKD